MFALMGENARGNMSCKWSGRDGQERMFDKRTSTIGCSKRIDTLIERQQC